MTVLPTRIWDEISMFPQNVPMPPPKTAAWMIGGLLHFVNLIVRISQGRRTPSSDFDWENADWKKAYRGSENMYHGGENPYRESEPWFDWVRQHLCPVYITILTRVSRRRQSYSLSSEFRSATQCSCLRAFGYTICTTSGTRWRPRVRPLSPWLSTLRPCNRPLSLRAYARGRGARSSAFGASCST
jgi:hypothetical protein